MDEARAVRWPATTVEIRQVFEAEEFAASDPTGELRAQEKRLRETVAALGVAGRGSALVLSGGRFLPFASLSDSPSGADDVDADGQVGRRSSCVDDCCIPKLLAARRTARPTKVSTSPASPGRADVCARRRRRTTPQVYSLAPAS